MKDCSNCKNCYEHPAAWGEFWCKMKNNEKKDRYVYDIHSLNKRFKKECENFIQK